MLVRVLKSIEAVNWESKRVYKVPKGMVFEYTNEEEAQALVELGYFEKVELPDDELLPLPPLPQKPIEYKKEPTFH